MNNDLDWYPDNRVYYQIAEFSVDFPERWFHFEDLFRNPYEGTPKEILDKFRNDIYRQMRISGCDRAYFFPDQHYGEFLYDKINLPAKEWLEYLMSGRHLIECAKNKNDIDEQRILNISDYVDGSRVLEESEYVHCFVDDFSNLNFSD